MKACLEESGYDEGRTGSPKQILKTAYSAGMINDEALWLDALTARNNVSHSYNHEIALAIVRSAKADFYQLFHRLCRGAFFRQEIHSLVNRSRCICLPAFTGCDGISLNPAIQ